MGQTVKLIKVEPGANNNKFYEMKDLENGTFRATWGRVGGGQPQTQTYSMSLWEKKYREKLSDKKGYKDVTELFAEARSDGSAPAEFKDITDRHVKQLIDSLLGYAKASVKANYTVSSAQVTQKQIDHAQDILDGISEMLQTPGTTIDEMNEEFVALFNVIPRKMKRVQDHLYKYKEQVKKITQKDYTALEEIIAREQSILDAMAGQVVSTTPTPMLSSKTSQGTILDNMGLYIELVKDKTIQKRVLDMMGSESGRFVAVYKATNMATEKTFKEGLKKAKHKKTDLLWHGSRNENWWNIIKTGLLIRPSNAVTSGSMFGDGIYFANKCRKSMGYTSVHGSYWAGGRSKKAYLALYEVHLGKQYSIPHSDSRMNYKKLRATGDYDSVFANKNKVGLYNDEFIVYQTWQSTIRYLVEISA